MTVDKIQVSGNQRVDLGDFEALASSQVDAEQIMAEFAGINEHFVVDGFAISNPSASQLQVAGGTAIVGRRKDDGQVQYGCLVTDSLSQTIDIAAFAAGTYGIYIRFLFSDSANDTRYFWNPSTDLEYAQSVAPRLVAGWQLAIALASPGDEWMKIGEVVQATMAITDQRDFYFEGAVDTSYASLWGSGNDRNSNRALYGVKDLHTALASLRQCVADIKGGPWYDEFITKLEIIDSDFAIFNDVNGPTIRFDTGTLDLEGFVYDRGNNRLKLKTDGSGIPYQYSWDSDAFYPATSSIDLGKSTNRFDTLYTNDVNADGTVTLNVLEVTDLGSDMLPDVDNTRDLGSAPFRYAQIYAYNIDIDGGTSYFSTLTCDRFGSDLLPNADASFNIGEGLNRVSNLYAVTAYLSTVNTADVNTTNVVASDVGTTTLTVNGLGEIDQLNVTSNMVGDLYPDAADTLDIGSSALRFRNCYFNKLESVDSANPEVHLRTTANTGRFSLRSDTTELAVWSWDSAKAVSEPAWEVQKSSSSAATITTQTFSIENQGRNLVLSAANAAATLDSLNLAIASGSSPTSGVSGHVVYTGITGAGGTANNSTIQSTSAQNNAGWLRIYVGTTPYFIPYFPAI
jgi:hypothetical protein